MCYDFIMTIKKDPPQEEDDDLAAKVAAAAQADSEIVVLQKKIEEMTEQLAKASDMASRAQAELQNVKIRLEREASDIRLFAAESVLLKLLPTVDNLQRALKSLPPDIAEHAWVKGIVAVEQDFLKKVGEMGLKRFESLGQTVDADRHEVLMQGEGADGTVVDVIEDGYELHGKVIRPAKVKAGGGV
jgi:molecular chaperone GrpE